LKPSHRQCPDTGINDANRQVSIPMAQAIVRSLAVNAAKGNQRAQRLFTQLLSTPSATTNVFMMNGLPL
jgi:hypothetical protein